MRGLVVSLVCAACVGMPVSAIAAEHAADANATRAYLNAAATYAKAANLLVGARVAAMEADEREVAAQCPSSFVYAPRDVAFEELGDELNNADWYAGAAPVRAVTEAFAKAIGHLDWSNRRLTRLVRSEAAEEQAAAALALPDVCGSIAAWKTSDYAELPPSVSEFLTHVEQTESGSFGQIMHLLKRYEGPTERRSAGHIDRLEALADRHLASASEAIWRKLEAAMGVTEL
jgi:hypothetical protein